MMKLQAAFVVAFYFSKAYGEAADGYVDLDGVLVPTEQCVLDSDANGYIFSCEYENATAVMYQEYFDGDYQCSGSGVVSEVTGFDYDCTPVGYMTFDLVVASCPGGFAAGSTALANGICHESSLTSTSAIYNCNNSSFTIERYSDSNCTMMINSTSYTDCYYIGDVDTGTIGVQPAYISLASCISADDDDETTAGPSTTLGDVDLSDYYGGYFNYSVLGIDVPLPIDECVLVDVDISAFSFTYGIVTCNNAETQATLRTYTNSDCSSDVQETIRVDADSGTFDCDSAVRYASLGISLSSTCGNPLFSLTFATGRCFFLQEAYTAVTCDPETTDLTLNAYADDECTELIAKGKVAGDDCEELKTDDLTVYYSPEDCVLPSPSPTAASVDMTTTLEPDSDKAVGLASTIGFTLVTIMVFVAAVVIV